MRLGMVSPFALRSACTIFAKKHIGYEKIRLSVLRIRISGMCML